MEYSERRVLVLRVRSTLAKSTNLTSTSVLMAIRLAGDFGAVSASLVVLEGDFRAGNFDAGLREGDLREGDLREGDRAGGEVLRVLAGDRGGETPLRVFGGLSSTALGRIRPLLVDIVLQNNYTTR